jgi:hypothetical protein
MRKTESRNKEEQFQELNLVPHIHHTYKRSTIAATSIYFILLPRKPNCFSGWDELAIVCQYIPFDLESKYT